MAIFRIHRLWKALVAVVLVISAVRQMLELTNRIHYGMTSRVISAARTDQARLIGGMASAAAPKKIDIDFTTVDLHVDYPSYVPFPPRFVSVDDRRAFISDANNRVYLDVLPVKSQLTGRVRVISNGVIRRGHECSWKTSYEEFSRLGDGVQSTTYVNKTLCTLLVPDGHTFQHFVDGVLPKLVQLLTEAPSVAAAVDMFVIYRPRDSIIYELLERVRVTRERLIPITLEGIQVFEARRLVDTCVTPSLHPRLWRRASQLLGIYQNHSSQRTEHESEQNQSADDQRRTLSEKTGHIQHHVWSKTFNATTTNSSLIVLLSRRWTHNGGRRLLNENAVLEYLIGRFGLPRVVRFGSGRVDLTSARSLFSRAAAVIGVHGGAFYNIILAPTGCTIVELMPLVARYGYVAAPPRRLAHTVIWRIADALGHTYWRLYAATSSPRDDVILPIDKLRSALTGVV